MVVESRLYELLCVPVAATGDEISKAYKKLALKYHPDKNNHDAVLTEKFKEISRAYEILKDPTQRRIYDQYGEVGIDGSYSTNESSNHSNSVKRRRQAYGESGSYNGIPHDNVCFNSATNIFSQVFKDINTMFSENPAFHALNGFASFPDFHGPDFGAAAQQQTRATGYKREVTPAESPLRQGKDIHHVFKVTLEDLYYGKIVKFRLPRTNKCSYCDGAGGLNPRTCRTCQGSGQVIVTTSNQFSRFSELCLCKSCKGTGIFVNQQDRCQHCNGGYVLEQKIIQAVIVPGSQDNDKIVLRGEADRGHHIVPGDVVIHLKETPHQYLIKKYNDLYMEHEIDLRTALLGGEIILPNFLREDNHVRILVNAHGISSINLPMEKSISEGEIVGTINPGVPKIVRGLGMPINNAEGVHYQKLEDSESTKNEILDLSRYKKGNLFIKFNIKLPSLSDFARGEADLIELERILPITTPNTVPSSGYVVTSHLANLPTFSPTSSKVRPAERIRHENEPTSTPPLMSNSGGPARKLPTFIKKGETLGEVPVPHMAPPRNVRVPTSQQRTTSADEAYEHQINEFNYNDIDIDDVGVDGANSADEEEFYNNEWS
ncbi:uncharacterized protein KQ657_004567 [Scheffersomyces spartinae]|uniref:Uncharacterized protein n=1 Tax=Scheffersomyces spartinae TaxID=45513 RepID=A0A9P8AJ47_9ASCO|nr:uncharacterized protein KQ657_004567 [Scheffersomyces spartinae]KAG7194355.1 hypothetical protein KQ657_004567 [Scheffersomyces spartinae]